MCCGLAVCSFCWLCSYHQHRRRLSRCRWCSSSTAQPAVRAGGTQPGCQPGADPYLCGPLEKGSAGALCFQSCRIGGQCRVAVTSAVRWIWQLLSGCCRVAVSLASLCHTEGSCSSVRQCNPQTYAGPPAPAPSQLCVGTPSPLLLSQLLSSCCLCGWLLSPTSCLCCAGAAGVVACGCAGCCVRGLPTT